MSKSSEMTFSGRKTPHLQALAEKMLRNEDYLWLKIVVDLLVGLTGGGLERQEDEAKEYWIERMESDFHPKGMGDSEYGWNEDYRAILELIGSERKALRHRK